MVHTNDKYQNAEDTIKDTKEMVLEMLRGHAITQLVASAARLDLFRIIDSGVNSPLSISRMAGIHETVVFRYLSALEALGFVRITSEGRVVATEALALLDKESGKLFGQALLSGDQYYQAWGNLDYALKSGKSAFEHAIGHNLWEELNLHPESAEHFTRTMGQNMSGVVKDILSRYYFPENGTIVDLGAGDGTLSIEILRVRPALRAILVEQESVFPVLHRVVSSSDVASRCTPIQGDILQDIPGSGDIYIMKSVLHNWGDEDTIRILKNCRRAMNPDSRLLLIERVILPQANHKSTIRDLVMLVLFGSGDRTVKEHERLLDISGLRILDINEDKSGLYLIEAQPKETMDL